MGYTQPYAAYKQTGIKTASQGQLIVLLYEGAIKHINAALSLIGHDLKLPVTSIEQFHNHVAKTQEIITELMVSLNMEAGGEIAKNLMSLYRFFNRELMEISVSHDVEKLQAIEKLLAELHETWKTIASNPTMGQTRPSLNING